MAKGRLFEYAVIYHPKTKKDAQGVALEDKRSVLITDLTRVLAESEKEVGILAARGIKDDFLDKLEDIEIIIRPF